MYGIRYSWQILTKLEFSRKIFRTIHKYESSWEYVQWEKSAAMRANMTKLTFLFRNTANAPTILTYRTMLRRLDMRFARWVWRPLWTWTWNGILESAHYKSASLYETTNKQRCKSCRGVACRVPPEHASLGHTASSVWADCTWGGVINILDRKEPDRDRADPLKSSL